jgi:hypothetical protein
MVALILSLSVFVALGRDVPAPKVRVLQFVMAECPMSSSLHAAIADEVMNISGVRDIVNFEQTFVGGPVGEGPVNETNWMQCFHGPGECKTHTNMLCANNHTNYDKWYDLVSCMDGPKGLEIIAMPENTWTCAEKVRSFDLLTVLPGSMYNSAQY